ncbi:T9SS type A sorting domain-containing protein [Microvirga sp. STS02]|uniref:T9SS type A sorting domain-containing protein n=1 Tax=Hymenobacter negativus TaxID=2795026 RepID=UPI0018DCAF95|nr:MULTISPECIES: T9SS type A sorting domain-containing protein [Bacteria]MBH8570592.1 T9SS type A sorting domain-containing protein [Hymenobacter negativus]MBR7210330.1 T9SS type A sorting domain-containing protein [Microvirga sp. STS02]
MSVDQGNGPVTYVGTGFNTKLIDQKPGSTTTPAFDINAGQLILLGGTVTTTESGTYVVNGATLDYTLYDPSFNAISNGALQLTQTSSSNGVRTFMLGSGNTNLISLISNAGNGYTIQVSFHATYQVNGTGLPQRANDPNSYAATFDVAGTKTPAPTIQANTIGISPNNSGTVIYNINPNTPRPFQGADLSSSSNNGTTYNVNDGQLRLDATTVTTTEAGANTITNVVLYYRTRLSGTPGGGFQPINLTQSGNTVNGQRTFILDPGVNGINPQPNLIATPAVVAAGNYVVDVYYQASGTNSITNTNFTITDPNGAPANFYSANFTVVGTPVAQTIWTGSINDNWFDARNWSNGVPDETKNALIRDLGAGSGVPYPNINSDATTPTYSNLGSGPAKALNLIMGGTSQGSRSITRLVKGQLKVYGNFDNSYDSFIQRENTIMEFAGSTTQTISGGSFQRVDISGGGRKDVVGIMNVAEAINFLTPSVNSVNTIIPNPYTQLNANAGVLTTDITKPLLSVIVLADRGIVNGNNGAQLNGETDISYLRGFARTTRLGVAVGETRTYGNMGLTLTFNGTNSPGQVDVTRNTVEAYAPVSGRFGIRRIFGVRPSDQATNTGGLTATMIFHYRDSETQGLNGPDIRTPGNSSIPEDQLTIFLSTNGGGAFSLIGRDGPVDQVNNNVTKTGVTQFATFTLGSTETPLPVRLMAFDAKRIGSDALVTWQTATEENSKGYEVQVSTNGTEYRTLASIPSASPNTTQVTNYSYVDKETNKTGKRYYRLHQIDLDGKDAFFAPTVVSFEGKAPASSFVAYPNPLNAGNELHVALQSAATGTAKLLVTDMTGRTLQQQNVVLTGSLTDASVAGMSDLKAGVYLVKLTLPTGEVKNLKVVKQ